LRNAAGWEIPEKEEGKGNVKNKAVCEYIFNISILINL
jgi:hypothetical protein